MLSSEIPQFLSFDYTNIILIILSALLILISIKIIICHKLIILTFYMSSFSLVIGVLYLLMDAPDVAMTEVALGACLSTMILINVVKLLSSNIKNDIHVNTVPKKIKLKNILPALILCSLYVIILSISLIELPEFGNKELAVAEVNKYYLTNTKNDIKINSTVAAILANYRGFDTMCETIVILIAGLGVLLIIMNSKNEKT